MSLLTCWIVFLELGMAFGTGSAVAHRAVDSVMGPRSIQLEAAAEAAVASAAPVSGNTFSSSCDIHAKAFQDVGVTLLLNTK